MILKLINTALTTIQGAKITGFLLTIEYISLVGEKDISSLDSLSSVAPFRIVNIGNSEKIKLLDFIEEIENIIGKKAIRNYMPMQKGDVPATWADATLLQQLTDYSPKTNFKEGIAKFISWYREHYKI